MGQGMATETRPYTARKTEGANTWEIVNDNNDEVVASGLDEETAKKRATLSNEMYEKASEEGEEDD